MPKLIDLTGKTFNRLTVLKRAEENKGGKPAWVCQCECGNIVTVAGGHLRSGHTQSCGCIQKEKARQTNFKDIAGQRFGKLIALRNTGSNEHGSAMWECKCDCGNILTVRGMDLRNGHTKSCGCISSFGEEKITKLLQDANLNYEIQKTFPSCKFEDTQALAKFDFYVNNKYLIEYDGKQHFSFTSCGWDNEDNFNKIIAHDKYKNNWCIINDIPLIRIPYTQYNNLCIQDLLLETTKFRVN